MKGFDSDHEFVKAMVGLDGHSIQFASVELQNDPEIIIATGMRLRLPAEFDDNPLYLVREYDVILDVLQHDGRMIERLMPFDVILDFSQHGGRCVNFRLDDLTPQQQERFTELVLVAVQQNGLVLGRIQPTMVNRSIVRNAVQQNGLALRFASEVFRSDPDIVCVAARQNHRAMQYACLEWRQHEVAANIGASILRCALGGFCGIQRHSVFSGSATHS